MKVFKMNFKDGCFLRFTAANYRAAFKRVDELFSDGSFAMGSRNGYRGVVLLGFAEDFDLNEFELSN